jgi:hypothetical protein
MRFTSVAICPGCAVTLLGRGTITRETPDALRDAVNSAGGPSKVSEVCFDSQGGNVGAAMAMGVYLRSHDLDTCVQADHLDMGTQTTRTIRTGGLCASACIYAFVGGFERRILGDARLVVHQMRGVNGDVGEARTQEVIATLAKYLDGMSINRKLLDTALSVPNDESRRLTEAEIHEWRVENYNPRFRPWEALPSTSSPTVAAGIIKGPRTFYALALSPIEGGKGLLSMFGQGVSWMQDDLSRAPVTLRVGQTTILDGVVRPWSPTSSSGRIGMSVELSASAMRTLMNADPLDLLQFSFATQRISHRLPDGAYPLGNLPKLLSAMTASRPTEAAASLQTKSADDLGCTTTRRLNYPTVAEALSIAGRIVVSGTVDVYGAVSNVRIVRAVGMSMEDARLRFGQEIQQQVTSYICRPQRQPENFQTELVFTRSR